MGEGQEVSGRKKKPESLHRRGTITSGAEERERQIGGGGGLLKGKYGLSGAYARPELKGGGGGGRKWCSSLGPKHKVVFNHQKHARD